MGAANTQTKIASPQMMIIKNTLRKEVSSGYFRCEQRLCMGILVMFPNLVAVHSVFRHANKGRSISL